jgi:RNA polymerase sigma-70 factor (ECF subfamily)
MKRTSAEVLGGLFDEHAAALVLFARQWSDTPEDVVQDAFVALAGQRVLPERAVAWLYRVVRNGAITSARRSCRRRSREQRAAARETAPGESWFTTTDERIDAEAASRMLAGLDGETRETIVARLWGGLTFEEIARLQGCSVATAYRRYQAGLTRLHSRLEPRWISTNLTTKPTTNAT